MSDQISVIAIIISVISLIFVAIREGSKLIFDFRESEITISRKRSIDESLKNEFEKKLNYFVKNIDSDKDKNSSIEWLGRYSYLMRNFSNKILDNVSDFTKQMLRWLTVSIISLTIAVIIGLVYFPTTSDQIAIGIIVIYLSVVPLFALSKTFSCLIRTNNQREIFRKTFENPTLNFCQERYEELSAKDLW